jgi:hypothetical protein
MIGSAQTDQPTTHDDTIPFHVTPLKLLAHCLDTLGLMQPHRHTNKFFIGPLRRRPSPTTDGVIEYWKLAFIAVI